MAGLANVLLSTLPMGTLITNSATVGSDSTFSPEGWKPGGVARWVNRASGIPVGFPRLSFSYKEPNKDSRYYRAEVGLVYPVLETIDPAVGIFGPKIAYVIEKHTTYRIHERATSADRTAFLNLDRSLLATTIQANDASPSDTVGSPVTAFIANLEDVF